MTSNKIDELWQAVEYGDQDKIIELLAKDTNDEYKIATSFNPSSNKPVLHEAAHNGFFDLVKYIVEVKNLDPNSTDPFIQITPLHLAARSNHIPIVKYLLAKGANVNLQDKDGYTAMHYAALNGNREIVQLLLAIPDINVNLLDYQQRTPLHRAVEQCFTDIAHELIVKAKADVNIQNNHGWTALHYASYNQRKVICDLLLNHGAKSSLKDRDGKQALFWGYGHWSKGDNLFACACPHHDK